MTLAARHDRLALREAVVVAAGARPTDEQGIALPGCRRSPRARVEIVETRGDSSRVRFGSTEALVAAASLRDLAR